MSSDSYIVAYSYSDKFEIPGKVAAALMKAKDQKLSGVKFGDQYYSTSFMWIQPKERTMLKSLGDAEMKLAMKMAIWLGDPVHELDWSYQQAHDYSLKLMRRCALDDVMKIWKIYAAGAYPSARKFLIEAKQLDPESSSDLPALPSGD